MVPALNDTVDPVKELAASVERPWVVEIRLAVLTNPISPRPCVVEVREVVLINPIVPSPCVVEVREYVKPSVLTKPFVPNPSTVLVISVASIKLLI